MTDQPQDMDQFSVVGFATSDAESFWDGSAFSLHVSDRSSDIHEFLNTEVHLKTAKYRHLVQQIQKQVKKFLLTTKPKLAVHPEFSKSRDITTQKASQVPPVPPAQSPETSQQEVSEARPGRFIYQKAGRTIEIGVSEEQYQAYFSEDSATPSIGEALQQLLEKKSRRAMDSMPEEIPPDESIASSLEQDEDMVSETMALLHLRQGNPKEATRIYQRLSLLFPEKSSYFEAQIQKIKEQ